MLKNNYKNKKKKQRKMDDDPKKIKQFSDAGNMMLSILSAVWERQFWIEFLCWVIPLKSTFKPILSKWSIRPVAGSKMVHNEIRYRMSNVKINQ